LEADRRWGEPNHDVEHGRLDIIVTNFDLGAGLNGQALAQEVVRSLPGLAVTLVTGNPEAFDDYRLRSLGASGRQDLR
jgi:hypothetical protein